MSGIYPGSAWIGLNDRDEEGTYIWANDDSSTLEYTNWGLNEPSTGNRSRNCVIHGLSDWENVNCDSTNVYAFFCDLEYDWILISKFRAVYSEYFMLTWQEANDYCFDKFGTELATMPNIWQGEGAYQQHFYWLTESWIGLRSRLINDTVVCLLFLFLILFLFLLICIDNI